MHKANPLFLIIGALASISLLVIFSISRSLALTQLTFWLVGVFIFLFAYYFNWRNWQRFSLIFYVASVVLLFLLLFVATPVRGSIRWIDFGPFRFQPSELAKISSIFLLASFYERKSAANIGNLILSFILIIPAVTLIFIQPDIGNALTLVAIWFGISLVANFRARSMLLLLTAALILSAVFYEVLAPYQKERIASFLNPAADPLGAGYNIIQSKIAVGSGKFLGRGLGRGPQSQLNFLPESASDFIFASTAEQLGFVGASIVIVLYGLLCLNIANQARNIDRFGALAIAGVTSLLLFQFLVNVGMNLGLIPVTGITLPLYSYGGSSLITTLFILGVAASIKRGLSGAGLLLNVKPREW